MKICFMPSDFDAPGCYRCLFPAKALRGLGHDAAMPPHDVMLKDDGGLLVVYKAMPRSDILVLQPKTQGGWGKAIRKEIQKAGIKVVYDLDANYMDLPEYNLAFHNIKEQDLRAMNAAIRASDMVTVTTDFLVETYSVLNKNTYKLPNCLDWDMWSDFSPSYDKDRELHIGWSGSLAWRSGDIEIYSEVLPQFLNQFPNVKFVSVGAPELQELFKIPDSQFVGYPTFKWWKEMNKYPEMLSEMDVGLVPQSDHSFNQSRSYLKGLEYAALGIPCIATPTQPYREFVNQGEDGFLCKTPEEWLDSLRFLATDEDRRRSMGRAAQAKARRLTTQARVGDWESLYESL